ncbi:hypothetical protein HK097_004905 [Rhizophlyctis rosea]|uniref:Importin N-terminal domain-containing protein n=1 Tax=Rhizophlyctis rosea TaxID=64517 RepID=A0AAD5SH43_9FUNG|nr:hypothetical protein HK097_004905 [Rhizophlyctis rosea]
MDADIVSQISQALFVVYSPTSSNEQRRLAGGFLEQVKGNPASVPVAHSLAHKDNGQPDELRYFGLSVLENIIKFKWNSAELSDADRQKLKELVVNLTADGLKGFADEKSFIKEKVAKIFVEVAKRLFPLQWADMDLLLMNMYRADEKSQEMVLLIYRSLAEDIYIYDDAVAELRKKELTTGMLAVSALKVLSGYRPPFHTLMLKRS